MRPSVFATKISDKPVVFPVDPTDPYTVTGEIHRSDAERQRCGTLAIRLHYRASSCLVATALFIADTSSITLRFHLIRESFFLL